MTNEQTYERITCADVQVGDFITTSRNAEAHEVVAVEDNASSRWLHLVRQGNRIRPGYAVKFWRVVDGGAA